jgi:transglutaminase-like putative cysteine protease
MRMFGMRWLAVLLLILTLSQHGSGQDSYELRTIPDGLRIDAPAVVRERSFRVEVIDREVFEETGVVAYTIYRSEGRHFGEFDIGYARFDKIKDFDGALYDARGEEIRTMESEDVTDESDVAVISLYDDVRRRSARLYHSEYPYTVEFKYRIRHNGTINYPRWVAQRGREGVVHTRMEVILAERDTLRYRSNVDSLKPVVTLLDGRRHYVWEASRLPELSEEELAEDLDRRTHIVNIAPREFELGGFAGNMSSWKSFGEWIARLYSEKGALPPQAKAEIASRLAGVTGDREKARRLYEYMQQRTRYVNVSLGIGGWEPYDAAYVYQRGYGDCKALSNFMVSILAEAGITAFPAVIDAGGSRSDVLVDFPSNTFNHVIVCVPLQKDSLWFECTSQIWPAGFLGSFTENRPALLITPGGGMIVQTPASSSAQNLASRCGRVELRRSGDARGEFTAHLTGNQTKDARGIVIYGTQEERERWLVSEAGVTGARLIDSKLSGVNEHAGQVDLSMAFDLPRLASVTGTRMFLRPNLLQRNSSPPRGRKDRKSPIRLLYPRVDSDTVVYALPPGMRPESLPRAVDLDASFGAYRSASVMRGDTSLVYTRRLELRQPEIPAEKYGEYVKFFQGVVKADNGQVVLIAQ